MASLLKGLGYYTFYIQTCLGVVNFKDLMNCYVPIFFESFDIFDTSLYATRA